MKPIVSKTSIFSDDRGIFFPLSLINTNYNWVQSNISTSKKYTFRGLHHQIGEYSQTKQITVITGSILDVLVDLREGSFEEPYFFKLKAGDQILIPKGFAHGFLSIDDNTMIQYVVDNSYEPSKEISFDWKSNETIKEVILAEIGDPSLLLMSDKDKVGVNIDKTYVEKSYELKTTASNT